jgi:dephospho-CoA kinase
MAKFIIAVTGGIASGKSAVTDLFHEHGIAVSDADLAARRIVTPGHAALDEIIAHFGTHFLVDGELNRPALRELVFKDPEAKKKLESITHPRIRELLRQECEAAQSAYAIVAIPLLTESGKEHYSWLHRILVVDTPRATQKARLLKRDNISDELAEKILDAQATREQRLAIADDVICNMHDISALKASVARLHQKYLNLSVGGP